MIRNILLSGGWGYGNLGDDAILMASLQLLHDQYPDAIVTITSYNPEYTRKVVGDAYEVLPSVHRQIFLDRAFVFLKVKGYVPNVAALSQIVQRIYARLTRNQKVEETMSIVDSYVKQYGFESLMKPYQKADLFVMSGGGYFNSWEDSMISRIIELEMAQLCRVKSVIIGQTLGPFNIPQAKVRLQNALKSAFGIYVRDVESQKELKSMGIESRLAPDLALSQNPMLDEPKDNCLAIVPAEIPINSREAFVEGVARIINEHHLSATVVVTRLYIQDVEIAKRIAKKLQERCGEKSVSLLIPEIYSDIENVLMRSKYVISRNLHGLILAWRSGAKCLCLNDERKFITFMNQIGHPENTLNANTFTADEIYSHFNRIANQTSDIVIQKQLSEVVHNNVCATLEIGGG